MKQIKVVVILALLATVLLAACQPAAPEAEAPASSEAPLFFGAYATAIEEPWDGVMHQALQKAAD